jgi:chromosome segregation ATPase
LQAQIQESQVSA